MVYSVCQQCNLAPKLPTISDAFRYVTKLQDCQDDAFPTCDKTVIVKPVLEGGREREWKLQISERGAQASAGLEWLESWPEHRRERGREREVNESEFKWERLRWESVWFESNEEIVREKTERVKAWTLQKRAVERGFGGEKRWKSLLRGERVKTLSDGAARQKTFQSHWDFPKPWQTFETFQAGWVMVWKAGMTAGDTIRLKLRWYFFTFTFIKWK